MKSDLVVIAGQQTAVNTFPFLVHKIKARLAVNLTKWLKSTPPTLCRGVAKKNYGRLGGRKTPARGPEANNRPVNKAIDPSVCHGEDF